MHETERGDGGLDRVTEVVVDGDLDRGRPDETEAAVQDWETTETAVEEAVMMTTNSDADHVMLWVQNEKKYTGFFRILLSLWINLNSDKMTKTTALNLEVDHVTHRHAEWAPEGVQEETGPREETETIVDGTIGTGNG